MIKDIPAKIKNLVSPNKKNAAKVHLTNGTIIEGTNFKVVAYGGGGGGSGGAWGQNPAGSGGGVGFVGLTANDYREEEKLSDLRPEDADEFLRELSALSTKHGLKIVRRYDELLIQRCQSVTYTACYKLPYGLELEWRDGEKE